MGRRNGQTAGVVDCPNGPQMGHGLGIAQLNSCHGPALSPLPPTSGEEKAERKPPAKDRPTPRPVFLLYVHLTFRLPEKSNARPVLA